MQSAERLELPELVVKVEARPRRDAVELADGALREAGALRLQMREQDLIGQLGDQLRRLPEPRFLLLRLLPRRRVLRVGRAED